MIFQISTNVNEPEFGTAARTGNFFVSIERYGFFSVLNTGKKFSVDRAVVAGVVVVVGIGVVVVFGKTLTRGLVTGGEGC